MGTVKRTVKSTTKTYTHNAMNTNFSGVEVSLLNAKSRQRIKDMLPRGALKKIQQVTGHHYNTVKTFENPEVIMVALGMLEDIKRLQKHQSVMLRKTLSKKSKVVA